MEKLRDDAKNSIKTDLIIDAIGNMENIDVPDEEINEAIKKLDISKEHLRSAKNSGRKDMEEYIRIQLRKQLIINFLVNNITVVEN